MSDFTAVNAAAMQEGISDLNSAHKALTDHLDTLDSQLQGSLAKWDGAALVANTSPKRKRGKILREFPCLRCGLVEYTLRRASTASSRLAPVLTKWRAWVGSNPAPSQRSRAWGVTRAAAKRRSTRGATGRAAPGESGMVRWGTQRTPTA